MSELIIAVALLCGQPTMGSGSYYALTDNASKRTCQFQLLMCLKHKTKDLISTQEHPMTAAMLRDCYLEVQ